MKDILIEKMEEIELLKAENHKLRLEQKQQDVMSSTCEGICRSCLNGLICMIGKYNNKRVLKPTVVCMTIEVVDRVLGLG